MRSELEAPESAVRKVNELVAAPETDRAAVAPDAPRLSPYQRRLVSDLAAWVRSELGGNLSVGQDAVLRRIRAFYAVFLAFSGATALHNAPECELPDVEARAEIARADKHLRALFRSLGLDFSATPAQRMAKQKRIRLEREEQAVKTAIPAPQMASGATDAADGLSAAETEELDTLAESLPAGRLAALESLSDRALLDLLRKERQQ